MLRRQVHFRIPSLDVRGAIVKQRRYAPAVGLLMTPVALAGYVLAFWRLGADLNWLGEFFISKGLLSRWQVWLAIAVATQVLANQLSRVGAREDRVTS